MRRKLVRQGQNALTVTLPAPWTKARHLEAGDEVEIRLIESDVLISTVGKSFLKRKTINCENTSTSQLRSLIASAYKSGCSEIELKFATPPAASGEIVNTFTGLEIVSQTRNSILIKSYVAMEEKDIDMLIIKLFQSVKVCGELVLADWQKTNTDYLHAMADGIKRLRDHCLRMINMSKYGGDLSYDYYELVTILEKIAADFYNLAEYVVKHKPREKTLVQEVIGFMEEFYACFLKKDFTVSEQAWSRHNRRKREQQSPLYVKKLGELSPFYYCLMERVQTLSSRILSVSG